MRKMATTLMMMMMIMMKKMIIMTIKAQFETFYSLPLRCNISNMYTQVTRAQSYANHVPRAVW